MRSISVALVAGLSLVSFSGCGFLLRQAIKSQASSPYAPRGAKGGYQTTELKGGELRVEFYSNNHTSTATAVDYTARRAREACARSDAAYKTVKDETICDKPAKAEGTQCESHHISWVIKCEAAKKKRG